MSLKWEKLGEEDVYNGYRRMVRRTFRSPEGKVVDFDIKLEGSPVCILAITKESRVLLAKQYRQGPEQVLLEIPGGGKEEGEEPIDAARRELLEETGYEGKVEFVGKSYACGYSTLDRFNFVATDCVKVSEPALDDNEFVEVVEMTIEEFREHLRGGRLTDIATGYMGLDHLGLL